MADPLPGAQISVVSTKYDGSFHRRQPGWFIERRGSLILIRHRAGVPIEFPSSTWTPPTDAVGHYWSDRYYAVFRRIDQQERLHGWYANVSIPAEFDGRTLRYVDLDIDLLVEPDGAYQVLDEDEFATNSARMRYPDDLVASARAALAELLDLIQAHAFPFNPSFNALSLEGRG